MCSIKFNVEQFASITSSLSRTKESKRKDNMDKTELIQFVRKHAMDNYEKSYGWSEVVECYSDTDIAGIIGAAETTQDAILRMAEVVELRDERYSDAIGPIIDCPD